MRYILKSIFLISSFIFLGCGDGGGGSILPFLPQSSSNNSSSDTNNDNLPSSDNSSSDSNNANPPSSATCTDIVITHESYTDVFPNSDVSWSSSSSDVQAIEDAFNYARSLDGTISTLLVMPAQVEWDGWSEQQQVLYILNRERYDRGIKPFEGISTRVIDVAQDYALTLYNSGTFAHNVDGSPWERLDRDSEIANTREFFSYAENLYVYGSSAGYIANPLVRALYVWIYDDAGSSWGHRKFCLATGLGDNSGKNGQEGLVGFGLSKGEHYTYGNFDGFFSSIVVMNAFDPSEHWIHTSTITAPLCAVTKIQ